MWFTRKPRVAHEERLQIHARLQGDEMLHITFSDELTDDFDIEGPGEIRLAIPRREFRAEVVRRNSTAR